MPPRVLVCLLLGLLLPCGSRAQTPTPAAATHCLLLPLDPTQRATQATLVVEGEVLASRSFWDTDHRRIYTAHQVRVFSSFKGKVPADDAELTVLTEGGTVELTRHELTNTLALQPGQQGVLFLVPATFAGTASVGPAWVAYGSQQGFIGYDLGTATAAEPFRDYGLITPAFYATLTAATGQPRFVRQPNKALAAAVQRQLNPPPVLARGQAPVISTLSPTTVSAGTGAVLTISGSGFGAARGTGFVEFRNADNGGTSFVKPQASEYVSWTDTRIQVRVPSLAEGLNGALSPAGSGPVRVTTTDQLLTTSTASITVPYAISNVQVSTTNQLVRPRPINQNGRGGYGFRLEAGFAANAPAVAAFRNALTTWRCQTGMNWDVETTPRTGRGAAQDSENSIGFDQGTELPANILGRTTSYYQGCFRPDGGVAFAVQEIDMQFDDATSWQFGPLAAVSPQLDFESVAAHELGHAQQLAHVILPRAVMHFAIARGQTSRTISADDVAGGRLVLRTRGFVAQGCGAPPLLPAPLTSLSAATGPDGIALSWATQQECFLENFVVERSVAADTSAWQTLATVPRATTGTTYRYLDTQPQPGLHYYRLRLRRPATAFGPASFDTAAPLAAVADAASALQPQLFPNPADATGLRLQYPATASGRLVVSVVDAIGRRHSYFALEFQPGLNLLAVPTAALRPGWYVLRFRSPEGQETNLPFVRQ